MLYGLGCESDRHLKKRETLEQGWKMFLRRGNDMNIQTVFSPSLFSF